MISKSLKISVSLIFAAIVAFANDDQQTIPDLPPLPPGFEEWYQSQLLNSANNSTMQAMGGGIPFPGDDTGGDTGSDGGWIPGPPREYATNEVWLETTPANSGFINVTVHNIQAWGDGRVLALTSKPDLSVDGWNVEQVFHVNTNLTWSTSVAVNQFALFLRVVDWTDFQTNGLPFWWMWEQFGRTDMDPNSDPYGSGNTLLHCYQNNIEPNNIKFSPWVSNQYLNSILAPIQIKLTSGLPFKMAFLVDRADFSTATWIDYNSCMNVDLGNSGWHTVWVGLRGRPTTSSQTWRSIRVKSDFLSPLLVFTNPAVSTVSQPMVQIQGFCSKPLASISYDLSNAAGVLTNQQVLVLDQYYDANVCEFTTNTFQAFDVPLTNGPNVLTFHATDFTGNMSEANFTLTLDYSSKTNLPAFQLFWPHEGSQISGNSFTCRGWVDNFTSTIQASVVDEFGITNVANAIIERDGKFWVEDLPLGGGVNQLTITISDAAGNVNSTNITVAQSEVVVTMNPVPESQLWKPTVNVTGTISNPSLSIWVNGVQGTNHGDGTWSAAIVPINAGGTAVFSFTTASPGSDQSALIGSGQVSLSSSQSSEFSEGEFDFDKPSETYVQNYTVGANYGWDESRDNFDANGNPGSWSDNAEQTDFSQNWSDNSGGSNLYTHTFNYQNNYSAYKEVFIINTTWSSDGTGTEIDSDMSPSYTNTYTTQAGAPRVEYESCGINDKYDVSSTIKNSDGSYQLLRSQSKYSRSAQTTIKLRTGGKSQVGVTNNWIISASSHEVIHGDPDSDLFVGTWPTGGDPSLQTQPVDPRSIAIMGMILDSEGNLVVSLPSGTDKDLTPRISGMDYYTFDVNARR